MADPEARHVRVLVGQGEDERIGIFPRGRRGRTGSGSILGLLPGAQGDVALRLAEGSHILGQVEVIVILGGKSPEHLGNDEALDSRTPGADPVGGVSSACTGDPDDADVVEQPFFMFHLVTDCLLRS